LPALAADLVGLPVAAIFAAGGQPSTFAAKAKTSTIPIVFSAVSDPVQLGLVASLNKPGGNVTGMSMFAEDLWAKSAELLKQLVPKASVVAYLINPSSPSTAMYAKAAAAAGASLGVGVTMLHAGTEQTLTEAFADFVKSGAGGLVVPNEPFFDTQRDRLVALATKYAVPAFGSTFARAQAIPFRHENTRRSWLRFVQTYYSPPALHLWRCSLK
jgi:putative ABC transport system substrate-binding protein